MNRETIQKPNNSVSSIFSEHDDDIYKTCPYCGQNKTPFKLGVCICGKQVGQIQYVNDPKKYVKNYYSYRGESNFD